MEKKSSVKDVHQVIKQAMPEIYKILCEKLGENNPFAKFNVGAGYYSWSDNRCQWKQMIEASDFEQSLINDSFVKSINNVNIIDNTNNTNGTQVIKLSTNLFPGTL